MTEGMVLGVAPHYRVVARNCSKEVATVAINWYPGHMVKAKREIEENMKLVDIVTMLLDARAPFSCRNSDLEKICRRKQLLFVLNKIDLAAPDVTQQYLARLRKEGEMVTSIDSTSGICLLHPKFRSILHCLSVRSTIA